MKSFNVPVHYRSPLVSAIKNKRKAEDKLKRDFAPTVLDVGGLQLIIARHFGFCYGVENAIEIAFRAVEENPGKRVFLLSEMIHNPGVNADMLALGVRFIMDTKGGMLISWDELTVDDVVIIPAFGTTLETEQILRNKGIDPAKYETTCPFVEKVWNRAEKIGDEGYTIVVHGKPNHEETRATFSHSQAHTATIVVKDMQQTELLARYVRKELPANQFYTDFAGQYSAGFDVNKHLQRLGVVNQTTMLASETQAIADYLRQQILSHYATPLAETGERFADTRDTLCYATNDNQGAVHGMLQHPADIAIVIGGYNSSNTSHLAELCEHVLPTYYISDEHCLVSANMVRHYDQHQNKVLETNNYLPLEAKPLRILITSGASCPDALVERVIKRLAELTNNAAALATVTAEWTQ